MKKLDFRPAKSKEEFRSNYKLHDLAERAGKNLLVQWGIEFKEFGEDKRYERLWEKGEDKPDVIIKYKNNFALLDWKGKHSKAFIVNERAAKAYLNWQKKLDIPVIIGFLLFDDEGKLIDRRFAFLEAHKFVTSEHEQWDKNKTVEFGEELPKFTKENLIKYLVGDERRDH
ncbi:MAG: hypothetical protein M1495_13045 [Bacteroidetes bacterium]|nr:hypothetical protein [Bacteroidota bacterium]MCL6100482.1 hypothetical protein [Bacteroidota bacterium]